MPREQAERGCPGSCTGSGAAGTGRGSGVARRMCSHLESKVQQEEAATKQAQPLVQKMDQARARFHRAVESGEKAMEALQKAQETFEQAQQEVVQGQTDLDLFMQEAPLPVMPVPQVNVSLVKSLEAVTGLIENMWKPEAGPPPDQLIHTIHESRQIIQTSSVIMSQ